MKKRFQPQFDSNPFSYYRADQKPGLSKGCVRAACIASIIAMFLIGLIVANADAIECVVSNKMKRL